VSIREYPGANVLSDCLFSTEAEIGGDSKSDTSSSRSAIKRKDTISKGKKRQHTLRANERRKRQHHDDDEHDEDFEGETPLDSIRCPFATLCCPFAKPMMLIAALCECR
jgi:hypothetical protein